MKWKEVVPVSAVAASALAFLGADPVTMDPARMRRVGRVDGRVQSYNVERARGGEAPAEARGRLVAYWVGEPAPGGDYLSRALLRPYAEVLAAVGIAPDRARQPRHCPFCGGRPSEVDDLVSLAMDLWAAEQGYRRIEPGLAGL
ncbi:MAG TPA: hypothetical protein VMT70_16280 [Vicinamibacteria bacterium]|nr:hypothetical protein [Vicinamibacteria bacterium]